jgi:hypothetical protein
MASVNKPDIKLGFLIAFGFFLFGLVTAAAQLILAKARRGS